MRQLIGRWIRMACRRILYVVLGLRIPAARIRADDMLRLHQQAADRVRAALIEADSEALRRFDDGERFWPDAREQKTLFDPEQLAREQPESLIDALHDWAFAQVSDFSVADAVMQGLKLDASKLTRDLQTRVGIALRKLGCEKVERRNGMVRYWYKPPVRNEDWTK